MMWGYNLFKNRTFLGVSVRAEVILDFLKAAALYTLLWKTFDADTALNKQSITIFLRWWSIKGGKRKK